MCGIAGFADLGRALLPDELEPVAARMTACLAHRGPDGQGLWVDREAGVALAHRRLAVIDLSANGAQPMVSADGRFVLSFNGEVYNFRDLRRGLAGEGVRFRGQADTEVLLELIARQGVQAALVAANAMFALALYDRRERVLHLARDRAGEKPLYYGVSGGTLLFASELKALRVHPRFKGEIDRGALALYLRHGYVPAPFSIERDIHKLPPASLVSIPCGGEAGAALPQPVAYWSARAAAEAGPLPGSAEPRNDAGAIAALDELLRDAVRLRLESDVPLGAFLSGGVDSSTVVALMQELSPRPVRTFTIGFDSPEHDEAAQARAVAAHLGTDHSERRVGAAEAMAVAERLPALWDEPFADASQVPTAIVAALAREQVTVSLSGDGGDELFGGYTRHLWLARLWRWAGPWPRPLRRAAGRALGLLSPDAWDAVLGRARPLLPRSLRQRSPGDKVHKLARALAAEGIDDAYRRLVGHGGAPAGPAPATILDRPQDWARVPDAAARIAWLDLVTYLPDDVLVKVDRATMAVGLEGRVPLLDHRVIELALRLPSRLKLRDGVGKWALRQVLYRHVPPALVDRPKSGFGVPLAAWLRGPMRAWAEALLDRRRLEREGWLDADRLQRLWAEHLSGRRNHVDPLWDALVFQRWLEARG